MSNPGVSDYPDKELLEKLWKSGMKAPAILEYLEAEGLPLVSATALAKYGQRNWNGKKEVVEEDFESENLWAISDIVSDVERSSLGSVERISISKTGYSVSVKPRAAVESLGDIQSLARMPSEVPRRLSKKSSTDSGPSTHIIIPDTQIEPGRPYDHLGWANSFIKDNFDPSDNIKIIHLGDHWNMGALSSYDKGKGSMEGRRYLADIEEGNMAFRLLSFELEDFTEKHFLFGNHEDRTNRAVSSDIQLEGLLTTDHMLTPGWERHGFLDPVNLDGIWYCLTPDHRILMRDLTYKRLDEVSVGEEIIAFDEEPEEGEWYRKYKVGEVLAVDPIIAPVYKITLESGKTFKSTGDHRWLARTYASTNYKWIKTVDLKPGSSALCRPMPEWDTLNTRDSGYIAGIFDGEGHITRPNQQQGGLQLGFAQNDNIVLHNSLSILDELDIKYKTYKSQGQDCLNIRILGSLGEKLKALGMIQANRLIDNVPVNRLGRVQSAHSRGDKVLSVEYIGEEEVIQIATSTETFIADGYASHNCHYWYNPNTGKPYGGVVSTRLKTIGHSFVMGHQQGLDWSTRYIGGEQQIGLVAGSFYLHEEDYKGPQGNDHWQGIVVLHDVQDGSCESPEFVSIERLCRKYEGMSLERWKEFML